MRDWYMGRETEGDDNSFYICEAADGVPASLWNKFVTGLTYEQANAIVVKHVQAQLRR